MRVGVTGVAPDESFPSPAAQTIVVLVYRMMADHLVSPSLVADRSGNRTAVGSSGRGLGLPAVNQVLNRICAVRTPPNYRCACGTRQILFIFDIHLIISCCKLRCEVRC